VARRAASPSQDPLEQPLWVDLLIRLVLSIDESPTFDIQMEIPASSAVLVGMKAQAAFQLDLMHPHEVTDVLGREIEKRLPGGSLTLNKSAFGCLTDEHNSILKSQPMRSKTLP
jgi:hypothetical protein